MTKYYVVIFLMLTNLSGFGLSNKVLAASPPPLATPAELSFAEIKITGNEFLMLLNNTGATINDLSRYWLYAYNNVNPLAAGVSSSSQQLPAASIANGQTILLSASGGSTCGAAVTGKLNLSFNDSGGYLEIVQNNLANGVLTKITGDSVSWSNGSNPAAGMISNVPSNSSSPNAAYYRYENPESQPPYLWQLAELDTNNNCQLNVKISGKAVAGPSSPGSLLLPGTPPPATFVESDEAPANETGIPESDIGLMAPQVNEVLPNPAEPLSDSEDEYIELYNANDAVFDLSGFKLEVGTSTTHTYIFPSGTTLAPKSFTAFMSLDTRLSLSNTGGQARFLDPSGNLINETEVYSSAKDGQAWALADGKWYWTTNPTPNAANSIKQPLTVKSLSVGSATTASTAKKASNSSASTKTSTPKAKAATTSTTKKAETKKPTAAGASSSNTAKNGDGINWLILAAVGLLALLYALYEYRHDLANQIYRLRRYREARAASRGTT